MAKKKPQSKKKRKNECLKVSSHPRDVLIPNEVREAIERLPEEKRSKVIGAIIQQQSFSSPFPPGEFLREYNEINPDIVNVLIEVTVKEQDHRHLMDRDNSDIRKNEVSYKKRGQTIAAWLSLPIIVTVGIFCYLTMGENNQTEVLRIFLNFVLIFAGLFLTGRLISGLENIFSNKNEKE